VRYVSAQSRHNSGVCTCLDESGLCLSILVCLRLGLVFIFSPSLALLLLSCFYFSMLLLLFFRSLTLVPLASLSSLFSIRARRRGAWVVLLGGLAALCLVSQLSVRSRGALLRRLGLRRCACDSKLFCGRSCTLRYPRPSSLHLRDVQ